MSGSQRKLVKTALSTSALNPQAITRTPADNKTIRVLHAVGGMNYGGTEVLLLNVLRHLDTTKFQWDFLVREEEPGELETEAQRLGARVIRCTHRSGAAAYAKKLVAVLREYGPYDAVHSHTHFFDGIVLPVAAWAGIPVRISHSHALQDSRKPTLFRLLQRLCLSAGIRMSTTHRVGVSEASYRALFGSPCSHNARSRIIRNGVAASPHDAAAARNSVRRELGLPEDAKVVGHVGRFDEGKNHAFLMACFQKMCELQDNCYLLLVGDGCLRTAILQRAADLKLSSRVISPGSRMDVSRILPAMDVFVFPSLHEGFGMALVEAQAHGLRCLASTRVPYETDVGFNLITFMDLEDGPASWAGRALQLAEMPAASVRPLKGTGYDAQDVVPEWLALYRAAPCHYEMPA